LTGECEVSFNRTVCECQWGVRNLAGVALHLNSCKRINLVQDCWYAPFKVVSIELKSSDGNAFLGKGSIVYVVLEGLE